MMTHNELTFGDYLKIEKYQIAMETLLWILKQGNEDDFKTIKEPELTMLREIKKHSSKIP